MASRWPIGPHALAVEILQGIAGRRTLDQPSVLRLAEMALAWNAVCVSLDGAAAAAADVIRTAVSATSAQVEFLAVAATELAGAVLRLHANLSATDAAAV